MKVLRQFLLVAMVMPACAQIIHAPDGGIGERFSSLEVPGKPGSPFRASVVTAWKYRSTTHWNKHTVFNRRTIARHSTGRVFQERRMFAVDGDHKSTTVSELDFYDPVSRIVRVYDPRTKQCRTQNYISLGDPQPLPAQQTMGDQQIQRENLGTMLVQGLQAIGSRESLFLSTQLKPSTVTEFWYSPLLGINLVLKRTDANGGMQTFTVENIDLHEPDSALFQPPVACNSEQ